MNALANDREFRINQYLTESGLAGAISVAKCDRGTSQAERGQPLPSYELAGFVGFSAVASRGTTSRGLGSWCRMG